MRVTDIDTVESLGLHATYRAVPPWSQTALDGRYIAGSGTFVSVEPKRWFHVETTIDSRVQTARNPALRQHWATGHGGNIRANIHAVRISAGTQN
jgi:hypothetical protein